ncbi:MAG: hypothetical protein LBM95_07775 [Lactobacillales bacterium]|jgi:hypothetical protein|nr:hypothetical protein [Lactobacillales bacterium]
MLEKLKKNKRLFIAFSLFLALLFYDRYLSGKRDIAFLDGTWHSDTRNEEINFSVNGKNIRTENQSYQFSYNEALERFEFLAKEENLPILTIDKQDATHILLGYEGANEVVEFHKK